MVAKLSENLIYRELVINFVICTKVTQQRDWTEAFWKKKRRLNAWMMANFRRKSRLDAVMYCQNSLNNIGREGFSRGNSHPSKSYIWQEFISLRASYEETVGENNKQYKNMRVIKFNNRIYAAAKWNRKMKKSRRKFFSRIIVCL